MKIFLDDWRPCRAGYELVRDYRSCIQLIEENKDYIESLSLDYDLDEMQTGYNVCEYLKNNNIWPKEINIHSTHSYGQKIMLNFLRENAPKETILKLQWQEIVR